MDSDLDVKKTPDEDIDDDTAASEQPGDASSSRQNETDSEFLERSPLDELYGRPIVPDFTPQSKAYESAAYLEQNEANISNLGEITTDSDQNDGDDDALSFQIDAIGDQEQMFERDEAVFTFSKTLTRDIFEIDEDLTPNSEDNLYKSDEDFFSNKEMFSRSTDFGVLDLPEDGAQKDLSASLKAAAGGFLSEPVSNVIPFQFDEPRDQADASAITGRSAQPIGTTAGEDIETLADAVQNALRNIYGSEAAIPAGDYDAGSRLSLTETSARSGIDYQPQDGDIWQSSDDAVRPATVAELDESTTEAVLSYLYSQNDEPIRREHPKTLHALDDLRAAVERNQIDAGAGYDNDWKDDNDADDNVSPMSLRGGTISPEEPAYYRSGSLRSPSSKPQTNAPKAGKASEPYFKGEAGPAPQSANLRQDFSDSRTGMVATPQAAASLADDRESGRMLGAAGLGLIGGIALAGILSVFLFNSVISNSELDGSDATQANNRQAPDNAVQIDKLEARLPGAESAAPVFSKPERIPAESLLTVSDSSGLASAPIGLKIRLDGNYQPEAVLVSIKGVPENARLSAGIDVGGGAWLLPPQRLADLYIDMPDNASGAFQLETQLMQSDARTTLSDAKPFTVNVAADTADKISEQAVQTAFAALQSSAQSRQDTVAKQAPLPPKAEANVASITPTQPAPAASAPVQKAALPKVVKLSSNPQKSQQFIRDGNRLMREGDIVGARKLYDEASALGDPDASLAMGRSFDPSYFERLQVKNGKPDPAMAFDWYMKALDGGVDTAKVKIDTLKQWLLR